MSIKGQLYVTIVAAGAGLVALVAYWVIATPEAEYRDVAIGMLVYAAGYLLAVPRANRWLSRHPNLVAAGSRGSSAG